MYNQYNSNTSMIDMLFNLVLGFFAIIVILILIMKTDESPPAAPDKNEFIITMNWNDESLDDIDIWILSPSKNAVGYSNKESYGIFLQRDDIGGGVDFSVDKNGKAQYIKLNEEIINIRKFMPGKYIVNLIFYRDSNDNMSSHEVTTKLIKINPYKEVVSAKTTLSASGQEITALTFEVNAEGEVEVLNVLQNQFVTKKSNHSFHMPSSSTPITVAPK